MPNNPSYVDTRPRRWAIYAWDGRGMRGEPAYRPDLQWAKNYADSVHRGASKVEIQHLDTGETHQRTFRDGWKQTRMAAQPELAIGEGKAG